MPVEHATDDDGIVWAPFDNGHAVFGAGEIRFDKGHGIVHQLQRTGGRGGGGGGGGDGGGGGW